MPKKTVELIAQSGNYYCIQVKANQKTLLEAACTTAALQSPLSAVCFQECGHGRKTIWEVQVFDASSHPKAKEWAQLQRFIQIKRHSKRGKSTHCQTAFYISNLQEEQATFFHNGIRGHWKIENQLHWVKDVLHKEDRNRITKKNGPVNASVLSTIALNIHRIHQHQSILLGQIKFAANLNQIAHWIRT